MIIYLIDCALRCASAARTLRLLHDLVGAPAAPSAQRLPATHAHAGSAVARQLSLQLPTCMHCMRSSSARAALLAAQPANSCCLCVVRRFHRPFHLDPGALVLATTSKAWRLRCSGATALLEARAARRTARLKPYDLTQSRSFWRILGASNGYGAGNVCQ